MMLLSVDQSSWYRSKYMVQFEVKPNITQRGSISQGQRLNQRSHQNLPDYHPWADGIPVTLPTLVILLLFFFLVSLWSSSHLNPLLMTLVTTLHDHIFLLLICVFLYLLPPQFIYFLFQIYIKYYLLHVIYIFFFSDISCSKLFSFQIHTSHNTLLFFSTWNCLMTDHLTLEQLCENYEIPLFIFCNF